MSQIVVTTLSTTAVKGTRLREVEQVALDECGARGDRAFYVIDERSRMINGKQSGELQSVVADYLEAEDELTLTFPDGRSVAGQITPGESVRTRFFSRPAEAKLVLGPWAEALSAHIGRPLRLVQTIGGVDRGRRGAASLISRASLARLAQEAGEHSLDARRFRMLIELDGIEPHGEDGWVGLRVQVGAARLKINGHVGRCLITSRDPDTGVIDLPTLDVLGGYRRDLKRTEPLPFGVYGQVLEPGLVRVGDAIELESRVRQR